MRTRRAGGLLAAALAAVLVAGGCASVPTEGQIRSGSKNAAAASGGRVGVEAQAPRTNAKPPALVSGFLEAMSDFNSYDTARQYMTPDAGAQWRPETKISVYDQSSTKALTQLPGSTTIRLRAPLVGTIDERGSWSSAPRGTFVQFDFKVVQADGQYRVSSVPPGVFLGSNQLESRLEPYALYFANRDRSMLVPDPIFLPALPPGQVATRLIQELLKGPTGLLGNGVGTAAPPGTQVNVSVPVELGEATVELSTSAAGLSAADRTVLAAQIMWTLRPISTRVKITVDGTGLVENNNDPLQFTNYAQYDPTVPVPQMKELYGVLNTKKIARANLDSATTIGITPLDKSQLFPFSADSFAVDLRGSAGAVVTRTDGKQVVAYGSLDEAEDENDKVDFVPTVGTVLRPSFDNQENLWILDRAESSAPRLRFRAKDGKITDVRVDFQGRTPVQLRMAPDGVRALVVLRDKAGQNSVVTRTITTDDAGKLQLTQEHRLQVPLYDITDATWNQLGVLVAGRPARNSPRQPWLVNVDGSAPRIVPGASNNRFQALHVASNPNLDTLPVVQDTEGVTHWQSKDLNWSVLDDDQQVKIDPLYPG
ncbi:LpqB family beta-propeller domain-containing protein [Kribbella sp. CA-253562]|uniref:LpqB family beta-propeller domain-containing protein n=1 Tax=Kribbella sp. CA-253562 TaxID=3239942 RepID=UPI003D8EE169